MEIIIEDILELVKKKMREQGAYDRDAFRQFTDETIYYYQERGRITDDDNIEFIEKRIMELWPIVADEFST
ncbi:hypothetical protein C0583_06875 [Candidatus Parcubacteria bacterium]|nr:MAG: hypothetical protein C0583_06875 [Candidatus Parcubacteria bacterium]